MYFKNTLNSNWKNYKKKQKLNPKLKEEKELWIEY